jgi:hypothetical protein
VHVLLDLDATKSNVKPKRIHPSAAYVQCGDKLVRLIVITNIGDAKRQTPLLLRKLRYQNKVSLILFITSSLHHPSIHPSKSIQSQNQQSTIKANVRR